MACRETGGMWGLGRRITCREMDRVPGDRQHTVSGETDNMWGDGWNMGRWVACRVWEMDSTGGDGWNVGGDRWNVGGDRQHTGSGEIDSMQQDRSNVGGQAACRVWEMDSIQGDGRHTVRRVAHREMVYVQLKFLSN